jgi:hypothetical protein
MVIAIVYIIFVIIAFLWSAGVNSQFILTYSVNLGVENFGLLAFIVVIAVLVAVVLKRRI